MFEHVKAISYNLQKYIFDYVLQASIKDHFTPTLMGFVIKSQIFNLTLGPSFDHNSYIYNLNEQCKGTLGM